MGQGEQVRVVLDLEVGVEPIRGLISGPGVDWRPFYGWMELAQALESVRTALPEPRVAPADGAHLLPI